MENGLKMDEIDSKYIVLKYYAIPETASNPSFSIVIVERMKYKRAREISISEQGDTRREERKSSNALFTAIVLQSLVCFTTIYRFIFLWTTLSDICMGKNIRISVPKTLCQTKIYSCLTHQIEKTGILAF